MRERSEVTLPDGVQLHVEVSGPADAPVTVVLLHGWCLDRRTWHHQIAALETLTENAPRIITYDTRGHGRSGSTRLRSATLGQLGDDLAEVLRRFAPTGPVVLAGHSMGGMAIMEYAHTHSEEFARRVGGLLFVSTTAEGHTHTRYGLPPQLATLMRAGETIGAGLLARSGAWRPHRAVMPALRPAVRWLLFGDEYYDAALRVTLKSVGQRLAAVDRRLPAVDRRAAAAGHAGRAGRRSGRGAGRRPGPAHAAAVRRVDRRGAAGHRTDRLPGRRAHADAGTSGRGVRGVDRDRAAGRAEYAEGTSGAPASCPGA